MPPFDPYLNWLGIPPHDQPPNFYRLLGVVLFESSTDAIEQAADRQSLRVGSYQGGPQDELCQRLLSEIAMARFSLLDPQQKAAYDSQLNDSLAHRGERAVASPPPPGGTQQFNSPPPQFAPPPPQFGQQAPQFGQQVAAGERAVAAPPPPGGSQQFAAPPPQFAPLPSQFAPQPAQFTPQAGTGQFHPGNGMPAQMNMPGPPQPMSAPRQAPAPMPTPQPAMQMPPAGFAPAMQRHAGPAVLPVAAPFPSPVAMPVATAPAVAAPAAPPARPPAAPQRPIDELESLASQPSTRRHLLKKRHKTDNTQGIVIGCVVAAATLLIIIFFAVNSQDRTKHGFDVIEAAPPTDSVKLKLAEEHKQKLKEIEKEKEKKAAAAKNSATSSEASSQRPTGEAVDGQKKRANQAAPISGLRPFEPGSRADDSTPNRPVESAPRPDGHDTPMDLGGDNDPVMGPLPDK